MLQSLEELRQDFIQEARSAPRLFRDLAKIEQYLAESYKTRAFIELIQNADDAQAVRFGICDFEGGFAVGNDGRPFTSDDLEALCRSGASHKQRGQDTIGYRGIGFKSVVNLAKTVYVLSGEYSFFFDKFVTKKMLPDIPDVPLIRIPHPTTYALDSSLLSAAAKLKDKGNYHTLFVFQDLDERLSAEEFLGFDKTCLMFLNNLRSVDIAFRGRERRITVQSKWDKNEQNIITIMEEDTLDTWDVLHSKRDPKVMVALKKVRDNIVPAPPEESVFHSFLPTIEFAGAYLKINGDYSTDPSRKTLDLDERSQQAFDEAVAIISETVVSLLSRDTTKRGFFSPFINAKGQSEGRFRSQLQKSLADALQSRSVSMSKSEAIKISSLRLRPDWLNFEDYEKLCHAGISPLSKAVVLLYPEAMTFLDQMGIQTLLIQEALARLNGCDVSTLGCAQLFSKCVKQYRFDLSPQKIDELRAIRIFPVGDVIVAAKDVISSSELKKDFIQQLFDNNEVADLRLFFSKLGIDLVEPVSGSSVLSQLGLEADPQGEGKCTLGQSHTVFTATPNLKQWRSAEKNAEAFIRSMKGVSDVVDVSKANLGYDLEVRLDDSRTIYIEIKSVSFFSEPFTRLSRNDLDAKKYFGYYRRP